MENDKNILITEAQNIAQKMKFSVKDFFRKKCHKAEECI